MLITALVLGSGSLLNFADVTDSPGRGIWEGVSLETSTIKKTSDIFSHGH